MELRMELDAFKCFQCGNHFSGFELGSTVNYPYRNLTEFYCKSCEGPAVTPAPKMKKEVIK